MSGRPRRNWTRRLCVLNQKQNRYVNTGRSR
jgi:hypothetical protein